MSQLAAMFPQCSITDDSWAESSMYRPPWFQDGSIENDATISRSDAIVCSLPSSDRTDVHWHRHTYVRHPRSRGARGGHTCRRCNISLGSRERVGWISKAELTARNESSHAHTPPPHSWAMPTT
jgi:hypothetical protein